MVSGPAQARQHRPDQILVLGIETSCDETAAGVVAGGRRILSNVVASQIEIHRPYGGVVPEVASRQHLEHLMPVVERAMEEAGAAWSDLDAVAVTRGPGLVGALLVGLSGAKALAWAHDLPLVGVNHLTGHIYANWLFDPEPELPAVCLVVSGGHSDLVLVEGHDRLTVLGRTRDDAAGEAFDKVARLLGLPYPGGPEIDRLAGRGNPAAIPFPRSRPDPDGFDFSFSGLKTAVAVELERARASGREPDPADVAASFQEAVVDVLVDRLLEAAGRFGVRHVWLAGGVAANSALRARLGERAAARGLSVRIPPMKLCTDNGAMIAAAGTFAFAAGRRDPLDLDAEPEWAIAAPAAAETETEAETPPPAGRPPVRAN
ncbi:MAG: tRNA (adenosine(37)-N6)-threonylcarbamoyltransferase complex transferase subunit TsaD [Bacillota bacterium]|nr:tRNA (adenosine(37)-N6)-threonylcarbamoyltransferase complex transferase subunit TsaD [Bacillota bacterium]